ncbi:hypothetical protein SGGMMB4_04490 [Sodalis glossinidius str. 'morsitans']|uniref:Uncharacterized protein n=1 Tax=Sodalis glossinidius (strain morsitans) TaxID=343509 RepID=A0A193QLU0_SODGM|nr:hypothetical protein SGGMMB4_04490 [Sodalis glossinidius str. 'morsitans']
MAHNHNNNEILLWLTLSNVVKVYTLAHSLSAPVTYSLLILSHPVGGMLSSLPVTCANAFTPLNGNTHNVPCQRLHYALVEYLRLCQVLSKRRFHTTAFCYKR